MAWNLGLLGASGSAAGSFDLLESSIFASGNNTSQIQFTNISTAYPEYQHLQLRFYRASNSNNNSQTVGITINGSGTLRYHSLYGERYGTGQSSLQQFTDTTGWFDYSSVVYNEPTFKVAIYDILDFRSSSKKIVMKGYQATHMPNFSNAYFAFEYNSRLFNEGPVNTISISGGTMISPLRFSLYGIKSA